MLWLHHGLPPSQQEKCHQYWPAERSARYQYFVVDPMAEYNMPQYILREFKVTDARVSRRQFPQPRGRSQSFTLRRICSTDKRHSEVTQHSSLARYFFDNVSSFCLLQTMALSATWALVYFRWKCDTCQCVEKQTWRQQHTAATVFNSIKGLHR